MSTKKNKASRQHWLPQLLRRFISTPGELARRVHIPVLEGQLRHIPGRPFHIMPELFFQLQGVNHIEFPGETHALKPGHACLIPRGLPHGERFRPIHGKFSMMVVMFDEARIRYNTSGTAKAFRDWPYPTRNGMVETAFTAQMVATLDNLAQLGQQRDRWSREARLGLAYGVIAWLGAIVTSQPVSERHPPKITRALYLIDRHLEDPALGTAMLAKIIGCTPDYLSDLFHRETGENLTGHINRKRMEKAHYLLTQTLLSVKEIAYACGYADPDYFGRLFRGAFGHTPSRHRANQYQPARNLGAVSGR